MKYLLSTHILLDLTVEDDAEVLRVQMEREAMDSMCRVLDEHGVTTADLEGEVLSISTTAVPVRDVEGAL